MIKHLIQISVHLVIGLMQMHKRYKKKEIYAPRPICPNCKRYDCIKVHRIDNYQECTNCGWNDLEET